MKHGALLITGGAGFIGSNFISYFLDAHPDANLVNLDALTYAGNMKNLERVLDHPRHTFIKGDICDHDLVTNIFRDYYIRGVVHFAAESHVDNSIMDPGIFIKTNVLGTYTLLEAARNTWMTGPSCYREEYDGCRFHHISTDEVYGSLGDSGSFSESTPYAPNSPYSASKAGSDFFVRSYHKTFGLNTVITNCSNNYGPRQNSEKLIPTIIRNALALEPIPIYGDGRNVRDWMYVLDHCKGIDHALHKGKPGSSYNFGGNSELSNIALANKVCNVLDQLLPIDCGSQTVRRYGELISYVADRPGHDQRYSVDFSKAAREFRWAPVTDFDTGIRLTVEWYLEHGAL